jgi:hypothetical protein
MEVDLMNGMFNFINNSAPVREISFDPNTKSMWVSYPPGQGFIHQLLMNGFEFQANQEVAGEQIDFMVHPNGWTVLIKDGIALFKLG